MPQTLSVIHILVSSKATKYRLPEQPGQGVPAILAGAGVGQDIARQRRQSDTSSSSRWASSPASEVTTEPAKLEHETAVKIEPESPTIRVTRRVRHDRSLNARISY
jgi:hypothetical protein